MTKTSDLTITTPTDREILVTRSFAAPRDLVFEAFTKAEHMKSWWGPHGSQLEILEMDVRPGGKYHFVCKMHGNDYHFTGSYSEVSPPEKMVLTQFFSPCEPAGEPDPNFGFTMTVTLSEMDGRTLMTSLMSFNSKEARDGMIASGMEGGMSESYERLDALVASISD